jgi:peptide chain release factor 2
LAAKEKAITEIQAQMAQEGFWGNQDSANKLMQQLKSLKNIVEPFDEYIKRISEGKEFLSLAEQDSEMAAQLAQEVAEIKSGIDALELEAMLSGPFDNSTALLSINAGAGGTESCDWASMLMRMYSRYAENRGYKCEVIDILHGDEAGIKNVTFRIEGEKAYGFLKAEKGVHRLVRISPFDSNKRRHTSFASVEVIPEVENDIEIVIDPSELRIDVFRASGPGGQSVNTTDSAVRVTHLPTGLVAQSQKERSQLQNKVLAMKVLRARLYEVKLREQEAVMNKEAGDKQKIEWGSQIRSYVLQPYIMVKDHRTGVESGNAQRVLDGDIQDFIDGYLKTKPEDRDKRLKEKQDV